MKAHREEDETAHGKLSELERLRRASRASSCPVKFSFLYTWYTPEIHEFIIIHHHVPSSKWPRKGEQKW
jgi:hypothetical protein